MYQNPSWLVSETMMLKYCSYKLWIWSIWKVFCACVDAMKNVTLFPLISIGLKYIISTSSKYNKHSFQDFYHPLVHKWNLIFVEYVGGYHLASFAPVDLHSTGNVNGLTLPCTPYMTLGFSQVYSFLPLILSLLWHHSGRCDLVLFLGRHVHFRRKVSPGQTYLPSPNLSSTYSQNA